VPVTLANESHTPTSMPPVVDFDALYRQHAGAVARWVVRLAPGVDVDDVVQEVFLVAHRRFASLYPGVQLRTWLFGITSHVVQSQRRKQRLLRWLRRAGDGVMDELPFAGPTPVEALEQRQAVALAYRALDTLREKHRQAFILFELEGMSVLEVADLMGIKVATIKVWLHRARRRFIEALSAYRGEESS
jgi:RNA polymerase sigma-70 factor (ECF subfamily)